MPKSDLRFPEARRAGALLFIAILAAACGGDVTPPEPPVEPDPPGTVTPTTSATVYAPDSTLILSIPVGAVTRKITVTANPTQLGPGEPNLMPKSAFLIAPLNTDLETPAELLYKYRDFNLLDALPHASLFIAKAQGIEWVRIPGEVTIDSVNFTVSTQIDELDRYALLVDACVSKDVSLPESFGARTRFGDCEYDLGGGEVQRRDYYALQLDEPAAIRLINSTDGFRPEVGIREMTADPQTGTLWGSRRADEGQRITPSLDVFLPAGLYQLYSGNAGNVNSTETGSYSIQLTERSTDHDLTCRGIFVVPPYLGDQAIAGSDCEVTITTSPDPTVIGKTGLEEYYNIKLLEGQTLTVTVQRTGGEDEFAPFPTLFPTAGDPIQPDGSAGVGDARSVTFTADSEQFISLGVSSLFKGSGDDRVATTGSYSLRIEVS